jgi:acyl-CoA thioesterase-2
MRVIFPDPLGISPMSPMDTLLQTLTLEPIEENLFRGNSPPEERTRIFGGQVVAQALTAAYKTVEGRICHSLQSYFIRPGDPTRPVLYQVERSRDGHSFTTRRVLAIQKGEQIFNMACSFQVPEPGFEHQNEMPAAPSPDEALKEVEAMIARQPPEATAWMKQSPIEMRAIDPVDVTAPVKKPAQQMVWLRARGQVGDNAALNQTLIAYASDYSLLGTAMRPHGVSWHSGVQTASLDHIIWYHHLTDFSQWHLYVQDSPSASGARGFNRGAIYRNDGTLVASTAQEGLIRKKS